MLILPSKREFFYSEEIAAQPSRSQNNHYDLGPIHLFFSETMRKAVLGKVVSTLILSETKPTEHNLVPYAGCFSMRDLRLCFTSNMNKILVIKY